ncbi:MAG: outer membrane protein assembly factor BamA [Acidobacteria bacterium]|nr:outer membrane protein assembly factor BamA [Acidobacteriota bacterium]MBI3656903.1 outer membrane protein assembly factor BamA [Acidobacteriota bacterium]
MIKTFVTLILYIIAGLCCPILFGQAADRLPVLRHIEINGNKRIPSETIRFYLRSQINRPVDYSNLEKDFRSLLKLGPFENVSVEQKDAADGAIIVFNVIERPFISAVEYDGVPPPMVARITDFLLSQKVTLRVNQPFDPEKGRQAERLIQDLLGQDGYASANVHLTVTSLNPSTVKLTFKIHKGVRAKVESIAFDGNSTFSDSLLRAQMRLVKQKSLMTLFTRKDVFSRARVEEDLQRLARYYQSQGFARVRVGEPRIEITSPPLRAVTTPNEFANAKRLRIVIPIEEGEIYRIASVARHGKRTSYENEIEPLLAGIASGDTYDAQQLQETYDAIKKVLGSHGYMIMNPSIDQNFDDINKTARITFNLDEVYPFYVRKVEFAGNRRIPDKMLRRALTLSEGDPFDESQLDRSLIKLNRTGLLEDLSRRHVDLKVDKEEREVDIIVHLKERQKQGLWFTGGSSGLGGGYAGAIYSAVNLLGLGEIFGLELTGGARSYNMVMDMITRNLFGSKFTLGFSLFRRFIEFPLLGTQNFPSGLISHVTRGSLGGSLTGSYPISEVSKIDIGLQAERLSSNLPTTGLTTTKGLARRSMTPAFSFDTTDHLRDPQRGQKLVLGSALSGGPLGGDISMMRPTIDYRVFHADPLSGGRNTLAFHGVASHVRGFGRREVPLYERFFSDGYLLRGFDLGQASPLVYYEDGTTYGVAAVGGDTLSAFNLEYRVPLGGPFSFSSFFDAGLTSALRDPKNLTPGKTLHLINSTNTRLRLSIGGELKVQMPMINQPLRFVFAINPLRLRQSFIAPDGRLFKLKEPRSRGRLTIGNSF